MKIQYAELLVKEISGWQVKGTAELSEIKRRSAKWQELGYKTKIRKV